MKGKEQLLAAVLIALATIPQALADPFIESAEEHSGRFHSHFDDFSRDLGNSGERMRESYDWSAGQHAQHSLAEQQAIQQGTHAMSEQEFQHGLMQAQMSGGNYNGNGGGFVNNGGLFGSGLGVYPMGGSPQGYGAGNNVGAAQGSGASTSYQPSSGGGEFFSSSNDMFGPGLFSDKRNESFWKEPPASPVSNWRPSGSAAGTPASNGIHKSDWQIK